MSGDVDADDGGASSTDSDAAGDGGESAQRAGGGERGAPASSTNRSTRRAFLRAAGASAAVGGAGAVAGATDGASGDAGTGLAALRTPTGTDPGQSPFEGPHEAPCRIPAAAFDRGGEGVAYHEASPGETYGSYRDATLDHRRTPSGGHAIDWIEPGEWWEYTVSVPARDHYQLWLRVALIRIAEESSITVLVDGEPVGDFVQYEPTSETWDAWQTVDWGPSLELAAGTHTIRVRADAGGWALAWLQLGDGGEGTGLPQLYRDSESLVALSRSTTSVTLEWGHAGEIYVGNRQFRVYRDGTQVADVSAPPLELTGLSPDTTYDVTVEPYKPDTNAGYGTIERSVTTLAEPDERAPLAPSSLTVAGEQTPRIDVDWTPVRDLGGAGVRAYRILLDGEPVREVPGTVTSTALTDLLEPGQVYEVGVQAVDGAGNRSSVVSATARTDDQAPTGVPAAPPNLAVNRREPTALGVSWDDPAADDVVEIEVTVTDRRDPSRSERAGETWTATLDGNRHGYDGTDLVSGVEYEFAVRFVDADGQRSPAATVRARTPAAPTDLSIAGLDGSSLTLEWTRPWQGEGATTIDAYAVSVEGARVATIDASEHRATVALTPAEHQEVSVAGVAADGSETPAATMLAVASGAGDPSTPQRLTGQVRTYLDPDVGDYAAAWFAEVAGDPGVSVDAGDGTVLVDGRMEVPYHDAETVYLATARFEGDALTLAFGATGGNEPAYGTIDYEGGVTVDRAPSAVVVRHLPTPFLSTWESANVDGTLLVAFDRGRMEADGLLRGALVLSGYEAGVNAASIRVALDAPDALTFGDVDLPDGVAGTTTIADDGSEITLSVDAAEGVDAFAGTDRVLPGENSLLEEGYVLARFVCEGQGNGLVTFDPSVEDLRDPAGEALEVATASGDVQVGDLTVEVAGTNVGDPDEDGIYEDLNGNGEFDSDDVVTYFLNVEDPAMQDNPRFFDVNGNGRVDFDDVVQLFHQL